MSGELVEGRSYGLDLVEGRNVDLVEGREYSLDLVEGRGEVEDRLRGRGSNVRIGFHNIHWLGSSQCDAIMAM